METTAQSPADQWVSKATANAPAPQLAPPSSAWNVPTATPSPLLQDPQVLAYIQALDTSLVLLAKQYLGGNVFREGVAVVVRDLEHLKELLTPVVREVAVEEPAEDLRAKAQAAWKDAISRRKELVLIHDRAILAAKSAVLDAEQKKREMLHLMNAEVEQFHALYTAIKSKR